LQNASAAPVHPQTHVQVACSANEKSGTRLLGKRGLVFLLQFMHQVWKRQREMQYSPLIFPASHTANVLSKLEELDC